MEVVLGVATTLRISTVILAMGEEAPLNKASSSAIQISLHAVTIQQIITAPG
jgi:hypothetical protein